MRVLLLQKITFKWLIKAVIAAIIYTSTNQGDREMKQHELLRHVADNIEAGREACSGLLFRGDDSIGAGVGDIAFWCASKYSLKPKTVTINGIEVECGVDRIEYGSYCYIANVANRNYVAKSVWDESCDNAWLERGLVFLEKEKAVAMAKAMLAFDES